MFFYSTRKNYFSTSKVKKMLLLEDMTNENMKEELKRKVCVHAQSLWKE